MNIKYNVFSKNFSKATLEDLLQDVSDDCLKLDRMITAFMGIPAQDRTEEDYERNRENIATHDELVKIKIMIRQALEEA